MCLRRREYQPAQELVVHTIVGPSLSPWFNSFICQNTMAL